MKKILIIFGSSSDARVYDPLLQGLKSLSIPFDFHISSAHKSPAYLQEILEDMDNRFSQIIAGAGLAAHLPGVIAAQTIRPVMGVPVNAALNGTDSLLSIMQMPPGVPVLSVGVDMYSEAVPASSTEPAPSIASGNSAAQNLSSAENTSQAWSPRLVNSSTRIPPATQARAIPFVFSRSPL